MAIRAGPRLRARGPRTFPSVAPASLGESFQSFFDAVDEFVSNLASVRLGPLLLALVFFTAYLTLRARASFNILRAAYPTRHRVPPDLGRPISPATASTR